MHLFRLATVSFMALFVPFVARAAEDGGDGHAFAPVFLAIVLLLLLARIGALMERIGQPAVLGELLMGVLVGAVALLPPFHALDAIRHNATIAFLAEIGVVLLLFRVGLESNIISMRRVGVPAFLVAIAGVVVPFVLGTWVVGPWLLPGLPFTTYLFLGATLTATSVGITARVFHDLGMLKTRAAQVVLGAAVIDDVLGLLILAVVSAIVSAGSVAPGTVAGLLLKAVGFLAGAIVLGQVGAPMVGRLFSRIHSGVGMKMALALAICGLFSYGAAIAGLAPIVGAFAAGLILDPVHFKHFAAPHIVEKLRGLLGRISDKQVADDIARLAEHEDERHVDSLIENVSNFFVPIFFVYTGMQVNLAVLADLPLLGVALGITVVAFLGKIVAGVFAGKGANPWVVGIGMIPRGEVGLIFANVGKQLGVVDDRLFAVTVVVVMLSTLVTPPVLAWASRRFMAPDGSPAA